MSPPACHRRRSRARSSTRPLRCRRSPGCSAPRRTSSTRWSRSSGSCAAAREPSSVAGMTSGGGRAPGTLEEPQVRAMFDRIASFYDAMNTVMTAGLHHRWRARAADLAAVAPGARALDVATGTGDLAVALAARVGATGEVVGSDFSEAMLERARAKSGAVRWEWANAQALPYE